MSGTNPASSSTSGSTTTSTPSYGTNEYVINGTLDLPNGGLDMPQIGANISAPQLLQIDGSGNVSLSGIEGSTVQLQSTAVLNPGDTVFCVWCKPAPSIKNSTFTLGTNIGYQSFNYTSEAVNSAIDGVGNGAWQTSQFVSINCNSDGPWYSGTSGQTVGPNTTPESIPQQPTPLYFFVKSNIASALDTTGETGVFTTPVEGTYHFTVYMAYDSNGSGETGYININVNGGQAMYSSNEFGVLGTVGDSGYIVTTNASFSLPADQQVSVSYDFTGDNSTTLYWAVWQCELL